MMKGGVEGDKDREVGGVRAVSREKKKENRRTTRIWRVNGGDKKRGIKIRRMKKKVMNVNIKQWK